MKSRLKTLFQAALFMIATASSFAQVGATDIDVLYIERTPRLSFNTADKTYSSGLPSSGWAMTYLAHVKNWGTSSLTVKYQWKFNGNVSSSGSVTIPAGGKVTVPYNWSWNTADNDLEFITDPDNAIAESSELNNRVEIRTNALLVGLWVEQSLYDYFHANQHRLGTGSNSFEDWGQTMVKRWNQMMAAVSPLGPWGTFRDRVALDKVVVVPDGALPLHGGLATNNPDATDRTVDMMWGYPYKPADCQPGGWYDVKLSGAFYLDYGSIHEMNHARFHIDIYGFDVHETKADNKRILVTDDRNVRVAGTELMPFIYFDESVYYSKWADIMGGPKIYDAYSAMAWNWKHHRRGRGNMNSPADIGVFLQDLPSSNRIQFVDQVGRPLAGAQVEVFQATSEGQSWYGKIFDNVPEYTLTADAAGAITLPKNPFGTSIVHDFGLSNGVIILKVRYNGQLYFLFQEVTDFNMAYWSGNTASASYLRPIDLRTGAPTVGTAAWTAGYYNGEAFNTFAATRQDADLDFTWTGSPANGVNPDHFSAVWQRDIAFVEGWKTMEVVSNGGVQVYIDGRLILNQWDNATEQTWRVDTYTTSADNTVVPGRSQRQAERRVMVRFRHATGDARIKLRFLDKTPTDPVPANAWRADIYGSTGLQGYRLSRVEPKINFEYGDGAGRLGAADPNLWGSWSTRWTGDWTFEPGAYRFQARCNTGIRVWIGDELVVDQWDNNSENTFAVDRVIDGSKRIVVEHNATRSDSVIKVDWAMKTASVSGTLTLSDYVGAKPSSITVELRPIGSTVPFDTYTVPLATDGSFTASGVPARAFALSVKPGTWLRKTVAVDATYGNVSGIRLTLVNGDVLNDNQVNTLDFNELSRAFRSRPGLPNWNPRADLNGDLRVDTIDWNILSKNWRKSGNP